MFTILIIWCYDINVCKAPLDLRILALYKLIDIMIMILIILYHEWEITRVKLQNCYDNIPYMF